MELPRRDFERGGSFRERLQHQAYAGKNDAAVEHSVGVQRVDGDGSRPAALVTITGKKLDTLGKLALRLNGMYWKGRPLGCSTMLR